MTSAALIPHHRDLVGPELASLAAWLGDRPQLWRPHVRHDTEQRHFHRLVDDPNVTVWLICWMPGHDTGFHDHDGSAGAVTVMQGRVREERLRWAQEPVSALFGTGELL